MNWRQRATQIMVLDLLVDDPFSPKDDFWGAKHRERLESIAWNRVKKNWNDVDILGEDFEDLNIMSW